MKVMCWVKVGYRKQGRAYFYASRIVSETERSIRFQMLNGEKITIKRNDLISIEEDD